MAALDVAAARRHRALTRVLEALDMQDRLIPTTKADPVETEAFYAEILAELAERVGAPDTRKRK
jgi:hypothetical protein